MHALRGLAADTEAAIVMEKAFEDVLSMLGPGQSVSLETGSPIYKGPYQSHILAVDAESVRIAAPMDQGKLVLIPVGTHVTVVADTPVGSVSFDSAIINRTAGRNRSLVLKAPQIPESEITPEERIVPFIAVSSGKGGVGKTTFVVNLALALRRLGRRVCVVDGDLGTANVDVLLNITSKHNLAHVVRGERHMLEVVTEGPEGLIILPGGSGFQELTTLDERKFQSLLHQFHELAAYTDLVLIDTGSGLSPSVTNFLRAADENILLTTPEPHAITDCYALIKVLALKGHQVPLKLVVNRAESETEAAEVSRKMRFASRRFLHVDLDALGYIVEDGAVGRSIRRQDPLLIAEPRSRAALQIEKIAQRMVGAPPATAAAATSPGGFLERMRRLIGRREERR